MFDYVYIIYAFVKLLDEHPIIICLSCHPGLSANSAQDNTCTILNLGFAIS